MKAPAEMGYLMPPLGMGMTVTAQRAQGRHPSLLMSYRLVRALPLGASLGVPPCDATCAPTHARTTLTHSLTHSHTILGCNGCARLLPIALDQPDLLWLGGIILHMQIRVNPLTAPLSKDNNEMKNKSEREVLAC